MKKTPTKTQLKFVTEIPRRKGHGERKYQALYDALQKKPGCFALVPSKTAATFKGTSKKNGPNYPGVRVVKRGSEFYACFRIERATVGAWREVRRKAATVRPRGKK